MEAHGAIVICLTKTMLLTAISAQKSIPAHGVGFFHVRANIRVNGRAIDHDKVQPA